MVGFRNYASALPIEPSASVKEQFAKNFQEASKALNNLAVAKSITDAMIYDTDPYADTYYYGAAYELLEHLVNRKISGPQTKFGPGFKTIQDLTKHPQLISDTLYKMDTSFLSETLETFESDFVVLS